MSDLYVNAGNQTTQTIVTRAGAGGDSREDSLASNLFFKFYIGLMVVVGLTVVGAAGWSAYYVSNYGFLSFDVAGLVDDIEHGDRDTAQAAAEGLAENGSVYREAVPLLAAIVADPRSPNRDIAAIALGEIGPAAYPAVPELIAALESPDEKLQIAAIDALGQIGEDAGAATLPLAGILENGDTEQRGLAARALAGIGQSAIDAEAALHKALDDPDPRVRAYAMAALLDIDAELPLDALDRFEAMLDDRDAEIRKSAVWGLGFLGGDDPAIAPHLIAALGDGAPDVREQAAWSLGMNGEAAGISVPVLVELLDDPEARVRAAAVWAIGQMGVAAVPAAWMLLESLEDSDPEVQREAYEALTTIAALSEEELPDVVAALDAHPLNVDAREHGRVSISKNYKN